MPEVFLTVEEAARRLAIAPYTVREWLKAGTLQGIKAGRLWRVPERALNELANGTGAKSIGTSAKSAEKPND